MEQNGNELMLGFSTEAAMVRAKEAVNQVLKVIQSRSEPLIIKGKQYLEFQDWQLVALYFGISTKCELVTEISETVEYKDANSGVSGPRLKFIGYIATASAMRDGKPLATVTAECTRYEKQFLEKSRQDIRAMATTRAQRNAIKSCLRWVFSMASIELPEVNKIEVDADPENDRLF